MPRTFTAEEFVKFCGEAQAALPAETHRGLEKAAAAFEHAAKAELGTYQREDMGPLDPWAELADATKADRVAQGYSANDPGLRSGEMRDATKAEVDGNRIILGNTMEEAKWFEEGTIRQPPRPFIATALFRGEHEETERVARYAYGAITGNQVADE